MERIDRVKHPKVLPPVAFYCPKQEKLLVYEYQPNGSLFKLLHGSQLGQAFDWGSRLSIATSIAETLAFMHQEFHEDGIAHGNLKSTNILFNRNMEPCISEYGLMVVENQDQSILSQIDSYKHNVLSRDNIYSTFKVDIYAFGVILLELLTGKLIQNNGFDLASWVHSVVREEWTVEVFDKALISEGASEERMVNLLQPQFKQECLFEGMDFFFLIEGCHIFHQSITPIDSQRPQGLILCKDSFKLFRLHDSGLDQAFVDALPVFYYKDIMGLKEPFDCAVCLCEFSDKDKLRLLPMCRHAFHIDCIDTWLLSNSTCPLCRGTLLSSSFPMENPLFNFDFLMEVSNEFSSDGENGSSNGPKPSNMEESVGEKRVFSVRLGKFRSLTEGEPSRESGQGETSNLDARRCYSMGTVQYVVGDSNLQVALSHDTINGRGDNECPSIGGDMEDKKIRGRTRGDSFSVSKIWLWSKKNRFPTCSSTHMDMSSLSRTHMDMSSFTVS
ncbi:hypothetical protein GH714_043329 [Hevea brasiliensis]|uniref:RING-type E3 ubiquitin transferase n=1 Tax=Hevea brasiliensis TaxID=3981 RepID=A0A6A6K683_HEVBR|nr:hypothetical protein GH714_043329 [Hevea brasiliensis]